MISNQILQNTIDGLKGITRTDLCVIDVEGKILAATFPNAEAFIEPAQAFVVYSGEERYPVAAGVEAIGIREMATVLASV